MIERESQTKTYRRGQIIFKQGQAADAAYVVKLGSVKLIRNNHGREQLIETVKSGDMFGEAAFAAPEAAFRYATARAAEDNTQLISVSQAQWDRILDSAPELVGRFARRLTEWLHRAPNVSFGPENRYPVLEAASIVQLMAWAERGGRPGDSLNKSPDQTCVFEYDVVVKRLKDTLNLPQPLVRSTLRRLHALNLVSIGVEQRKSYQVSQNPANLTKEINAKSRTVTMLTVIEPDQLVVKAKRAIKDWPDLAADDSGEFMDLEEFAEALETDVDNLLRRIGQGDIPSYVFLLHRDTALNWAEEKGKEYFQKRINRQFTAEDLADITGVLMVDDETIQQAVTRVGPYKLVDILAECQPKVRDKIMSNMSARMQKMVADQIDRIDEINRPAAIDQESRLLAAVKKIKGIN